MNEGITIKYTIQHLRNIWGSPGLCQYNHRWIPTIYLCKEVLNIIESLGGHRFSKPDSPTVSLPMSTLEELLDILEVMHEEI